MKRYYFISSDLDDLVTVESELKKRGLTVFQIHVLSRSDADVELHKLHEVASVMKQDIVRSTTFGALIGVIACVLVLAVVGLTNLATTEAGWLPFVFLALILVGFFAWEGGLKGIQEPNKHFRRFQKVLSEGKHIFFADVDPQEARILKQVIAAHPGLEDAGIEPAGAHWLVACQQKCQDMIRALP